MALPLDRFTNLATTTLSSGIDNTTNPVTLSVGSSSGFPNGPFRILIDNELLQVTAGFGTTSWTATRNVDSTSIASHLSTAAITHVVTAFEANNFLQIRSPFAYGGYGDNSHDDTNAFQGAINDAHVNGEPIWVGSYTWKIQSALTTYNNVLFISSGAVFTGAGASSVAPLINFALSGTLLATTFSPYGLTGAVSASRWVGATASGSPVSGSFLQGDWIITLDGKIWICTVAGTQGTWVQPAPALTFGAAGDIQPLGGSAVAGSSGKIADAQHVHPTTGAQTWPSLQTFNGGIQLNGNALQKTRNASDNVPVLGSGTGTANGVQIWITSTDPGGAANEGDLWFNA